MQVDYSVLKSNTSTLEFFLVEEMINAESVALPRISTENYPINFSF